MEAAVARPELPVGTWGKIRREKVGNRRFRARARFRDFDGVTRYVEAWGESGAAAERALRIKLRDRSAPANDEITADMRITRLGELWLNEVIAEERVTPQTISRYETSLRTAIRPALGNLRIREATVSRLDRFLKVVAAQYPAKARGAKVVLGQMLGMAVRHGALTTNPVRDIGRLRKRRRAVKALKVEDLQAVRAALRNWQTPPPGKPGPRHTDDLADIVDLLPRFAVDMLLRRQIAATANPNDAIFPSRRGTWQSPNNVRRQWREARKDTGLEWVTPHTFRKTVATLIDREADAKTAAEQLGHSNETITDTYYIEKAKLAPDVSDVLQTLGAGGAAAA